MAYGIDAFNPIRHSPARCLRALPSPSRRLNELEHGQQLGAGGPRGAHVQVAQLEVQARGVAQVHPALQGEALAAGVGDGVAQPRVAQ